MYAEAAQQHLGVTAAEAHYWMLSEELRYPRHGYDWTAPRRARFLDVITTIADGIEAGLFPAAPGDWNNFRNTHEQLHVLRVRSAAAPAIAGRWPKPSSAAPELRRRATLMEFDPADAEVAP